MALPHQFQPGSPGRPPGHPNRLRAIQDELKALGFDWVKEAVARYRHPDTPNASKDYALGLIVDRVAPKLKSVEVTGANGSSLQSVLINVIAGSLGQQPEAPIIEQTISPSPAALSSPQPDLHPLPDAWPEAVEESISEDDDDANDLLDEIIQSGGLRHPGD